MPIAPGEIENVRQQLQRILESSGFARNERMSRFLRFLAERHLEGSDDQLKESVLAIEVFGRKPGHDPAQDSIVRTEAGRLRARLAEYYLAAGKDDEVVIELPKGGYTPAFRFRTPPPPNEPAEPPPSPPARRRIWPAAVALLLALGLAVVFWAQRNERFWRSPLQDARFLTVTDFDGAEHEAAISRDGKFVAFLSTRDGPTDVWITQPASGQFRNLTHGALRELGNPLIRSLGFSPDGSLVTCWVRKPAQASSGSKEEIDIWAVPALGGPPRIYLAGAAEFDWSADAARLTWHTPAPGDPLFVSDGSQPLGGQHLFTAPAGLHSHFPLLSPDGSFVYFVLGALPDKLDIWRIRASGSAPERITSQNARVTHPILLDRRTLVYLASDSDGSGPWLYSADVDRRIPHRLTFGVDRFTSLAGSADGKRLVVTRASPKSTLWRLRLGESADAALPSRLSLTPAAAASPRLAPGYLLYVSSAAGSDSIWKNANGSDAVLWTGEAARIVGAPTPSPDGAQIAFAVRRNSQSLLYVMQADGSNARVISASLEWDGSPAWTPDGSSITAAAIERGQPHLYRIPLGGGHPTLFLHDYSAAPAWQPNGSFVVYSGPDIGTTFTLKAATADGQPRPLPPFADLTRGARRLKFLPGGSQLVFLRGSIEHKDVWLADLASGSERRLTTLAPGFDIRDFDVSPDAHEVILERVEERSDIVLLDRTGR